MTDIVPIRVMIVDDHEHIRTGLSLFLDTFDDLQLAGEAADGREAIRLCAEARPNVILMDLVMPEMNGIQAIRAIHQMYPEVGIIALTGLDNRVLMQQALQAGAIGCLHKDVSIDRLAQAIRAAGVGHLDDSEAA